MGVGDPPQHLLGERAGGGLGWIGREGDRQQAVRLVDRGKGLAARLQGGAGLR
jgi:hypothetical protein